jgi:hypothetical protein
LANGIPNHEREAAAYLGLVVGLPPRKLQPDRMAACGPDSMTGRRSA